MCCCITFIITCNCALVSRASLRNMSFSISSREDWKSASSASVETSAEAGSLRSGQCGRSGESCKFCTSPSSAKKKKKKKKKSVCVCVCVCVASVCVMCVCVCGLVHRWERPGRF